MFHHRLPNLKGENSKTVCSDRFFLDLNVRMEVEVRVGNAAATVEVTGEMIKGGGNRVVDCIWRLCNMAFESGVVPEDWRFVIVPLYKDKGERIEYSNYRGISLSVVEKNICTGKS